MFTWKLNNKLAFAVVLVLAGGLVHCIQVEHYGSLYHPEGLDYYDEPAPVLGHHHKKDKQNLHKIPGVPGVDYPLYHEVPPTSFSCESVPAVPGMYANVETGCQAYHVCQDGREGPQGSKFLCTNGTIFNQKEFTCDWWYNVDCHAAPSFYSLNADPAHNPYFPKKKLEPIHEGPQYYGP